MSVVSLGILRMPPSLWSGDELDVTQRHSTYTWAADEIERLTTELEKVAKRNEMQRENLSVCGAELYNLKLDIVAYRDRLRRLGELSVIGPEFGE